MLPCALGLEENNGNKSINDERRKSKDGTLERDRYMAKYIVCAGLRSENLEQALMLLISDFLSVAPRTVFFFAQRENLSVMEKNNIV